MVCGVSIQCSEWMSRVSRDDMQMSDALAPFTLSRPAQLPRAGRAQSLLRHESSTSRLGEVSHVVNKSMPRIQESAQVGFRCAYAVADEML